MASGDTLVVLTPLHNETPGAKYATPDTRNRHPVLDFDAGDPECALFTAVLPRNYAGGGVTVTLIWAASSANTNDVLWNVAFDRLADEDTAAHALTADTFASCNTVTQTCAATNGQLEYSTIAFTAGAQMDSTAAGELFHLHVARDAAQAGDTMTGDAELVAIEIKET